MGQINCKLKRNFLGKFFKKSENLSKEIPKSNRKSWRIEENHLKSGNAKKSAPRCHLRYFDFYCPVK